MKNSDHNNSRLLNKLRELGPAEITAAEQARLEMLRDLLNKYESRRPRT